MAGRGALGCKDGNYIRASALSINSFIDLSMIMGFLPANNLEEGMIAKRKRRRIANTQTVARHLSPIEFRAIAFVATSILAGIAILNDIKDPVVWTFLGTAIGISLGQSMK